MDLDEFLETLMKTERVPKYPHSMYYSEGAKYLKLFQYEKALEFLNEAVANNPTDIKSLLKRSKCNIALREYTKAIDDANAILDLHPNNMHAINLKGQAQYLMGDFEGGYMTYSIGKKIRPADEEARLGEQICREALDNSLHTHQEVEYGEIDFTKVSETGQANKFEKLLLSRRGARECFGEDAKFMEDLMRDENLVSVHKVCKEAVDYIKYSEKFWCVVNPLNFRKKRQKIKRKDIKQSHKAPKPVRMCMAAKYRAENAFQKERIGDCISEIRNWLIYTDSLEKENENEKMLMKCDAYHLLSLANMRGENMFHAFKCLSQELEIAKEFNLILQQTRAYHQLGKIYQLAGKENKVLFCLKKIVDAMSPEKRDRLIPENASPTEICQINEADKWAKSVSSSLMNDIRNSVLEPVMDALIKYSEESNSEHVTEGKKEKYLKKQSAVHKRKSSESLLKLVNAEESDTLNTLNKTNVSNQPIQFSHEGILDKSSTFEDRDAKIGSSEREDLAKLPESVKIRKSEEFEILKTLKGLSKSIERETEVIEKSNEKYAVKQLTELEKMDAENTERLSEEIVPKVYEPETEFMKKQTDTKRYTYPEYSHNSAEEPPEEMLDSAIQEPKDQQSEPSRIKIRENLDESNKIEESSKIRESDEVKKGETLVGRFEPKTGHEKEIDTTKIDVENISSEEDDTTEEIDYYKRSEDEMPTEISEDEIANETKIAKDTENSHHSVEELLEGLLESVIQEPREEQTERTGTRIIENFDSVKIEESNEDKKKETSVGRLEQIKVYEKEISNTESSTEDISSGEDNIIEEIDYCTSSEDEMQTETHIEKDTESSHRSVEELLEGLLNSVTQDTSSEDEMQVETKIERDTADSHHSVEELLVGLLDSVTQDTSSEDEMQIETKIEEDDKSSHHSVGESLEGLLDSVIQDTSSEDEMQTEIKIEKNIENSHHSVGELLEGLLDSVIHPREEQTRPSKLKIIDKVDDSSKKEESNYSKKEVTSQGQFEPKKGYVKEKSVIKSYVQNFSSEEDDIKEEIDYYASSEDEMQIETLDGNLMKSAKFVKEEKSEECDFLKMLTGISRSFESEPEVIYKSNEKSMMKQFTESEKMDEENFERENEIITPDVYVSESEFIKKQIDTKRETYSEYSHPSVEDLLEEMLDSVIQYPKEEHSGPSRIEIIENFDDSSKIEGLNEAKKDVTLVGRLESKRGHEKETGITKRAIENISSEEDDIKEEIEYYTRSDDEMQTETKIEKDTVNLHHSVEELLEGLMDSVIREPRLEQTRLRRIKIIENLDESSKMDELDEGYEKEVSTIKRSAENLSSEEDDIKEEIDYYTSSDDEMPEEKKH